MTGLNEAMDKHVMSIHCHAWTTMVASEQNYELQNDPQVNAHYSQERSTLSTNNPIQRAYHIYNTV